MKFSFSRSLWAVAAVVVFGLGSCSSPFGTAPSTSGPAAFQVRLGVGMATASWRPVLGAQSYRLEWSSDAAYGAEATHVVESTGSPEQVDGLTPGVAYHFRVRAELNNGPTAWSESAVSSSGWTWARPAVSLGSSERQETTTVTIGGVSHDFVTTYTDSKTQHDQLRYDGTGVTWTTWVRTSSTSGAQAPIVVNSTEVKRTGSWSTRWVSFSLDGGTFNPDFSTDRTSFTLGGETWSLVK